MSKATDTIPQTSTVTTAQIAGVAGQAIEDVERQIELGMFDLEDLRHLAGFILRARPVLLRCVPSSGGPTP